MGTFTLAPMQLGLRILICIGGFIATSTSLTVTTKENDRPSDDMFIATLAEKFQAFGDGAGPISCPQFEYPILVPPAQSYLTVTENGSSEPISYKKKRYSPFFFMRLPAPTALPKSAIPWSYHYTESESEANFINTNGGDSTQPSELAEKVRKKRYSPMLRVWRHQLGDEENVANSGMVPDYNGIDKRYTPFLNPIKTSKGHGEYDIDQILEVLRLLRMIKQQSNGPEIIDQIYDKRYIPFINGNWKNEHAANNLQEQDLEKILEVLSRIREWKQQKGPHPSNQGIKAKRYAPFSHSFNKNQDFKKRYTPFIHFWKDQEKNGQKSPKRFEEQDLNPVFEDLLSNLEERVNVKRPFELVTILQNGQICFSGRNLGVRIPKNNPEQLPYYMALLGRMLDSICPASKGCILQG